MRAWLASPPKQALNSKSAGHLSGGDTVSAPGMGNVSTLSSPACCGGRTRQMTLMLPRRVCRSSWTCPAHTWACETSATVVTSQGCLDHLDEHCGLEKALSVSVITQSHSISSSGASH